VDTQQDGAPLDSGGVGKRAFSLLGGLTLSIAGIGIYGTVAYATAQRTREIGVRRALGAHPAHVLSLVVSETLEPVAIGGTLGLGLAVAVGYFARSRLHEVTAADARSLATAAAILAISALIACLLPAVRALRVDPVIALRSE